MKILVFGGTGFVGLNIAEALLKRGHTVTLFDRAGLPPHAQRALAVHDKSLSVVVGDVLDRVLIEDVMARGFDTIILGAAITAGAERDAADPDGILQVNLLAQVPILAAARKHGVRRVVNLSSAAAYGTSAFKYPLLDEELPCDPVALYAVTKFASEKVVARLGALWHCDFISVRLSAVFGPWERATGVRDTLSPLMQLFMAKMQHRPALLARAGVRDWIYAPDVADAIVLLIEARTTQHRLYNISTGAPWSALEWGEALSKRDAGFVCRIAGAQETATIDLHGDSDRAPMSVTRLEQEFGWRARYGCADSAAALIDWSERHSEGQ